MEQYSKSNAVWPGVLSQQQQTKHPQNQISLCLLLTMLGLEPKKKKKWAGDAKLTANLQQTLLHQFGED